MSKALTLKEEGVKHLRNSFTIVGECEVTDDTYSVDNTNADGTWQYSRMSLGIKTSDKNKVFVEQMGGFRCKVTPGKKSVPIYAMDTSFKNSFKIEFANRHKLEGLVNADGEPLKMEHISNLNKYRVGIEKNEDGELIVKEFLHEYDLINYLKESLIDGTRIKVRGDIELNSYQGTVTQKRIIKSVFLANDGYEKMTKEKDEDGNEVKKTVIEGADENQATQIMNVYITKDTVENMDTDDTVGVYLTQSFGKIGTRQAKSYYIDKDGNKQERMRKVYPIRVNLTTDDLDKKLKDKMKIYLSPIKDKEDKVFKVSLVCDVVEEMQRMEITKETVGDNFDFFEDLVEQQQLENATALSGLKVRKTSIKGVNVIAIRDGDNNVVSLDVVREEAYGYEDFINEVAEYHQLTIIDDEYTEQVSPEAKKEADELFADEINVAKETGTVSEVESVEPMEDIFDDVF